MFGYNVIIKYRELKMFFCMRCTCMVIMPKTKHPNFKVDHLFKHVIKVSTEAWLLDMELSCDMHTQGFQGNHRDKSRIIYKVEDDGFHYDSIYVNGYTY